MKIDPEKCVGCGQCVLYCPIRAISLKGEVAEIDYDRCAECTNCLRSAECPVDAIYQQELVWPRTVRSILSDVLTIAQETGLAGRGTEEMKTNEVTGRFKPGWAGVGIELGRPVLGARFYDVEKVAMAVARLGVEFEKDNPTTSLMENPKTGKFKGDVLQENVLSAILEFAVKLEQLPELFEVLKKVSQEIETVFSLDLACRVNVDWTVPVLLYAEKTGLWYSPNGKMNVGLGRPRVREE